RSRQAGEPRGVVDTAPADERDARAVAAGEHAPPVLLPLVDPPLAVERLADERRGHGPDARESAAAAAHPAAGSQRQARTPKRADPDLRSRWPSPCTTHHRVA